MKNRGKFATDPRNLDDKVKPVPAHATTIQERLKAAGRSSLMDVVKKPAEPAKPTT